MRQRLVAVGTLVAAAGATIVTALSGTPRTLPAVSLGSPVLLHAERVVALVLAFVVLAAVIDRALRGELPIEFRGMKYADKAATEDLAELSSEALATLAESVDKLDERLASLEAGR